MGYIFTSDLNPFHMNKWDYVLPPKYSHKDLYDAQFQDRTEGFISAPQYAQKVQTTDKPPIQVITNGIGIVQVNVYNAKAKLFGSFPMTVVSDIHVPLPFVRQEFIFDGSAFPEGFYFFTLSNAGNIYRLSDWIEVSASHPKTLLFEYYHTWDKFNTFFTDGAGNYRPLSLRVEATLLPWYEDSSFVDYTDEYGDHELIDGIPLPKREIRVGNGYGVPDYLGLKLGKILLLNRTSIDGEGYSRSQGSKMTPKKLPGHPMFSYNVEIMKRNNRYGLATDETGSVQDPFIAATLNAQAFGNSNPGSVINIQTTNVP